MGSIAIMGAVLSGSGVAGLYIVKEHGSIAPPASPPASGTANIFIDTSGGTCTRSASAINYVDAAACGSFTAAYNIAVGGDTINVRCGTYAPQNVPARSIGTNITTIQKDPGDTNCTRVSINGSGPTSYNALTGAASYLTLKGFQGTGTATAPSGFSFASYRGCNTGWTGLTPGCAADVKFLTLTDFKFNQGWLGSVSDVTLSNGEIGPLNVGPTFCPPSPDGPEDGLQLPGMYSGPQSGQGPDQVPVVRFTMDNVYIHDIHNSTYPTCGAHTDAIQGFGFNHWTINAVKITNSDTCILAYAQSNGADIPGQMDTMLVQNSSFINNGDLNHCLSFGDVRVSCTAGGITIQNNTFISGLIADWNCAGSPQGTFRNNLVNLTGSSFFCQSTNVTSGTYNTNVFMQTGNGCNTTTGAKVCTPSFVDGSHALGNVDLANGDTCAKNYVTTGYPATDINGTTRPQGTNADAGAMEVVGG